MYGMAQNKKTTYLFKIHFSNCFFYTPSYQLMKRCENYVHVQMILMILTDVEIHFTPNILLNFKPNRYIFSLNYVKDFSPHR